MNRTTVTVAALVLLLLAPSSQRPGTGPWPAVMAEELFEVDAEEVASNIDEYIQEAHDHVSQNRIRNARQVLDLVEQKLEMHRKILTRRDRDVFRNQSNKLRGAIEERIDSLVEVNLAILKEKGSDAAIEFRRTLASQSGISEAELAPVDEAIVTYQPVEQVKREKKVRAEAEKALEHVSDAKKIEDEELRAVATRIEQAREDSVRAEQARQDSIRAVQQEKLRRLKQREKSIATANQTADKIDSLLDAGNPEEANTVFEIYEANLERYLGKTRFGVIKQRVSMLYAEFQQKLGQASESAERILILVERKRAEEAKKLFGATRGLLRTYLDAEAFAMLEKSVKDLWADYSSNRSKMQAAAAKVGRYLDENEPERAYKAFQKSQEQMRIYLDKDAYEKTKARVESAYSTMQDKKKWASLYVRDIEALIERNRGAEAHARFAKSKAELKQYLDARTFSSVSDEVAAANRDFITRQKKARACAEQLAAQLAHKEVPQAYQTFQKRKDELQHYMADEKAFETLRLSVYDAYREWQQKTRWAAQYARGIESLIGGKEGASAFTRFTKEKPRLKQYLAPAAYDSLSRAVTAANSEYARMKAKARTGAKTVRSLLVQHKAEEAYTKFQKGEAGYEHYLERAAYEKLRDDVETAYRALLAKQKEAQQHARQIRTHIDRHKGDKAYALFRTASSELKKYLEPHTFTALGNAVSAANTEHAKKRSEAAASAKSIRSLLAAGRVQKAFEAFKGSQADLEHYLKPITYHTLKTNVENAYKALLARRKDAAGYARSINWALWRRQVKEAGALFAKHDKVMRTYLDESAYKGVRASVKRAQLEYDREKAEAEAGAAKVKTLLAQKRIKEAYSVFDDAEGDLKRYLREAEFNTLKKKVEGVYGALQEQERNALQQMRAIRGLIRQGQGVKAYSLFVKEKPGLQKHLDAETYTALSKDVAQARGLYKRNVQRAEREAARIRSFVSRGNLDSAYAVLARKRKQLRDYLGERTYAGLEKTVVVPYEKLRAKRKEAKADAAKIQRMLKKGEAADAHTGFYSIRSKLKKYLPRDEYNSLSTDVAEGYAKHVRDSKRARTAAANLYGLLEARRVEQAYSDFKKVKGLLRKHLDPEAYSTLEAAVTEGYSEYAGTLREVKAYERGIYGLIRRGEVWPAYRKFRSKRTWLKKYLDEKSYSELESSVTSAYRNARRKK